MDRKMIIVRLKSYQPNHERPDNNFTRKFIISLHFDNLPHSLTDQFDTYSQQVAKMSSLSSISDYRAYHILSYGTFLGATFFQSFVSGIVAFRTLPRVQFGRLQSATVPVFFSIQTILPLVMALTYPGNKLAQVAGESLRANSGISGVLAEENRYTVLLPIALLLVTSAANLFILGPATTKTMKERHHQGRMGLCSRIDGR